jgi:hypothetical protein
MPWTTIQENWKWFQNDAVEPITSLADENVKPTLLNDSNIIRLRTTLRSMLGGGTYNNCYLEYSTDQVNWNAFGAGAHWNYANGQATEGDATTTYKTTDGSTYGKYHESATISETWVTPGIYLEIDWAIVPTANVQTSTTYYFRMDGSGLDLLSEHTYPQVLTAGPPHRTTAPLPLFYRS